MILQSLTDARVGNRGTQQNRRSMNRPRRDHHPVGGNTLTVRQLHSNGLPIFKQHPINGRIWAETEISSASQRP